MTRKLTLANLIVTLFLQLYQRRFGLTLLCLQLKNEIMHVILLYIYSKGADFSPMPILAHQNKSWDIFFQQQLSATKFTHVINKPFSHLYATFYKIRSEELGIMKVSITFVKFLMILPKQSIRPMCCIIHDVLLSSYQEN